MKDKAQLGESKYKKLTLYDEHLSPNQVKRYFYTFEQVIVEAVNYGLIKQIRRKLNLTTLGLDCLKIAKKSKRQFYNKLLSLMEPKYFAFYKLINLSYKENSSKNGLLIFPIYSPLKLGIQKSNMKTNGDWFTYSEKLKQKLESDILYYLGKNIDLGIPHSELLEKLVNDQILFKDKSIQFDESNYNSIISRFRKYWLNYFLQKLYHYKYSFDTFNIWVERGKQFGLFHSTEFYPGFDGRLVYPTSIISKLNVNTDLKEVINYDNGEKLYAHWPVWQNFQETFVDSIVNAYFDLKKNRKTVFIGISDLREKVCHKLRIPSFLFNDFIQEVYNMNLKGDIKKIQISLEADRLPNETNALYLKREPILVNGAYKNIIAIDYKFKK